VSLVTLLLGFLLQAAPPAGSIEGLVWRAGTILVPLSVSRFRFDRYIRPQRPAPDGQFTIRGIAPGDYKLFAWESIEPNAYLNIDYLRPYEDSGIPVHLEPNGTASVPLRAIPSLP
jgi:hypothetical protein